MTEVRITFRGKKFNARTRDMLIRAEALAGFQFTITQGSYNTSVGASAGTHAGGGAFDVNGEGLTQAQRKTVELCLRRVGHAAWIRNPDQGDWNWHIHAIAIGDDDLSPAALNQVKAYLNGRNGLKSNLPDDGPRMFVDVTWEKYLTAHPLLEEDMELTDRIGDYKDPDGTPLTVGEALVRGNYAYMVATGQQDEYQKANPK